MDDAALLAQLNGAPTETAQRFADWLVEAQTAHDIARVEQLVAVAEPLARENPLLRPWHTYARGYLALAAHQQPKEAAQLLETVWAQQETLPAPLVNRVLNGLGIIYETNEQWDRAAKYYQDAVIRCEADGDLLGLGKALANMAIVAFKGLEYEAAIDHLTRSIAIFSAQPDTKVWQLPLARAWNELGLTHLKLENLTEAHSAFEHYLALSLRWDYSMGQGIAYINLAHVHQKLQDTATAANYFTRAQHLLRQADDPFNAAEALYGLGVIALEDNDPHRAEAFFDDALALAQEVNNHEIITQIFLGRAELQEKQGNVEAALDENRQAVATVESLRANIAVGESRIRLQGARIEAYEKMVTRLIHAQKIAEAFQFVEMAKARVMVELLAGHALKPATSIPAEWTAKIDALRTELDELYRSPPDAAVALRSQINSLEGELNDWRTRIRLRNPEFDSLQTVAPLTLADVQARLPADTLMLEYFIAGDTVFAFWVTADEVRVVPLPITHTQLQRAFDTTADGRLGQIRRVTAPPGAPLQPPWILEKLWESLLAPLGETWQDYRVLGIIPHSILHYVPFHALYRVENGTPQYLNGSVAQPRTIVYAPSATVWLDYCQRKPVSPHQTCVAVGVNGEQLTRAEQEAAAISRWTKGVALTGAAATREAALLAAAHARILHLSCHGWFNPTWPLSSGLHLADGTLDATDVLENMTLQAELVSLSACETGRSRVLRGDELVGLTRAFLYAGTPAVLASHWLVDEMSTQLLMERFYQLLAVSPPAEALAGAQNWLRTLTAEQAWHLLASETIDENLLQAQLDFLAQRNSTVTTGSKEDTCIFAHPYYWASFFLVGGRLMGQPA